MLKLPTNKIKIFKPDIVVNTFVLLCLFFHSTTREISIKTKIVMNAPCFLSFLSNSTTHACCLILPVYLSNKKDFSTNPLSLMSITLAPSLLPRASKYIKSSTSHENFFLTFNFLWLFFTIISSTLSVCVSSSC